MNIALILFSFLLVACSGVQSRYHQVEAGDTLSDISSRYDVPVSELRKHNGIRLSRGLQPGTKLYIPFEESPNWVDGGEEFTVKNESRRLASRDEAPEGVTTFSWPVSGLMSSPFGPRVKGYGPKRNGYHDGIDIAARTGTPVKSARSGHVIYAGNRISGYGKMVILRHADTFSTVYAHLSKIDVTKGQFIARGQRLGRVGKTGRATAPHLHFEVRNNRVPVNPLLYLQGQYATNKLLPR